MGVLFNSLLLGFAFVAGQTLMRIERATNPIESSPWKTIHCQDSVREVCLQVLLFPNQIIAAIRTILVKRGMHCDFLED